MEENQRPGQSESVFSEALNKKVKIVYNDGLSISIMRGVLIRADDNFVFIKGDFNQKLIAINKIIKLELEK